MRMLLNSCAIALVLAGSATAATAQPTARASHIAARVRALPPGTQRPTREVLLSIGQGELITLPTPVTDIWVSAPNVADVYVDNNRQIHLFGKAFGEATVFATGANGAVVYSATVLVNQNLTSVDGVLKAAMPDADIKVVIVGQIAVLTGTVAAPEDSAQAQQLVTTLLNPGVDVTAAGATLKMGVINRLKVATPLQVNLQVRVAEVSRNFVKNIGVNLTSRDNSGGFLFGIAQGRQGAITTNITGTQAATGVGAGGTQFTFPTQGASGTTLGLAGHLLGLDLLSAIDLGETTGQVTTLANPNLTALSGETGTFLAGGEVPIPIAQGLGAVSVDYKQYGVSLAYTPTVLSDGRISLRVRPEVSQLDYSNAVTISGTRVPGLTTRRTETTVQLGSGQSMMISGLLSNTHNNSLDKAPGLGDLPIIGALFRSNQFQRNETELVIIITPYLVKPVNNPRDIALPSDGYKAPTDLGRVLMGDLSKGTSGAQRPVPTAAPASPAPVIGAAAAGAPMAVADARVDPSPSRKAKGKTPPPSPGFSE